MPRGMRILKQFRMLKVWTRIFTPCVYFNKNACSPVAKVQTQDQIVEDNERHIEISLLYMLVCYIQHFRAV